MPHSVIITASNGDLAEAIAGVLREEFSEVQLHGADPGGSLPGKIYMDTMDGIPFANDENYPSILRELSKTYSADHVVLAHDHELSRVAQDPKKFDGIPLLNTFSHITSIFGDKYYTAQWLLEKGLPAPKTYLLKDAPENMLPCIVKPRKGAGSKGVLFVDAPDYLEGLRRSYGDDHIAQEYLPESDGEYTCAVVRLQQQSRVLIMKRTLDAGANDQY